MKDGLYRIVTSYLCAGFVVENGGVIKCAPILERKIHYWKTIAVYVHGSAAVSSAAPDDPVQVKTAQSWFRGF